jgi:hypothetical protein
MTPTESTQLALAMAPALIFLVLAVRLGLLLTRGDRARQRWVLRGLYGALAGAAMITIGAMLTTGPVAGWLWSAGMGVNVLSWTSWLYLATGGIVLVMSPISAALGALSQRLTTNPWPPHASGLEQMR